MAIASSFILPSLGSDVASIILRSSSSTMLFSAFGLAMCLLPLFLLWDGNGTGAYGFHRGA